MVIEKEKKDTILGGGQIAKFGVLTGQKLYLRSIDIRESVCLSSFSGSIGALEKRREDIKERALAMGRKDLARLRI